MEMAMETILEDIEPAYLNYIIYLDSRGRKCMYSESKKDICVTLEASVLLWTKLSKSLVKIVYHKNEYDWCVMNKFVKGKQVTILWNVIDLKCCKLILTLSLSFFLTLMPNM